MLADQNVKWTAQGLDLIEVRNEVGEMERVERGSLRCRRPLEFAQKGAPLPLPRYGSEIRAFELSAFQVRKMKYSRSTARTNLAGFGAVHDTMAHEILGALVTFELDEIADATAQILEDRPAIVREKDMAVLLFDRVFCGLGVGQPVCQRLVVDRSFTVYSGK